MLPFVESKVIRISSPVSGGSDTTGIDDLRQGVEIRTDRHRFMSMQPKMWSGRIDHVIEQTSFGQNREASPAVFFADIDKFDPVTYINAGNVLQLPRRFDDTTMVDTLIKDGVLEPLSIRDIATRESIDFPNEAHEIKACVCGGNLDIKGRTNDICQEVELHVTKTTSPFIDDASGVGATTGSILLPGISSHIFHEIRFFDDTNTMTFSGSLVVTSSMFYRPTLLNGTKINSRLAKFDFGTFQSNIRSTTAGAVVGNDDIHVAGTDSIAFVDLKSG